MKLSKMFVVKKTLKSLLTVQRGSEEKDVKIKREKIHVKSVEYKKKVKLELLLLINSRMIHQVNWKDAVLKAHKDGLKKDCFRFKK